MSRSALSLFASWARPNLKSSAAVLYGFRLNENVRGQSSSELNSQSWRLWNTLGARWTLRIIRERCLNCLLSPPAAQTRVPASRMRRLKNELLETVICRCRPGIA